MKKRFDAGDANRVLMLKPRPTVDHDTLLNAVADNLAYDPNNVHHLETLETTNPAHSVHTYGLRLTFHNVRGNQETVGDILDALNLRDWRMVCDRFLCVMLEILGRNPEAYDWPTPKVKVTYSGDPDADDLTTDVQLEWDVDEMTYLAATSYEQFKRKSSKGRKKRTRDTHKAWVLLHRIEFEEQAQQTENVDPFLFTNKKDAITRALAVYRSDCNRYFGRGSWCKEDEQTIRKDLPSGSACVCATNSDNIVFELYQRSVVG